jgi:hypothetical protein
MLMVLLSQVVTDTYGWYCPKIELHPPSRAEALNGILQYSDTNLYLVFKSSPLQGAFSSTHSPSKKFC